MAETLCSYAGAYIVSSFKQNKYENNKFGIDRISCAENSIIPNVGLLAVFRKKIYLKIKQSNKGYIIFHQISP